MTGACQSILIGHEGEISKVAFNPQGVRILTASSDKTARLWDAETGDCLQVRPFKFIQLSFIRRYSKVTQMKFLAAHLITVETR